MPFIRVGDLLTAHKRSMYPAQSMGDAMQILAAWKPILKQINCLEKFDRTRPLAYKQGKLTIQAASNTVAGELKMFEEKILAAYAVYFKAQVVQRIIIKRN